MNGPHLPLRDLMRGGRHARRTIVQAFGVSLPTADRWIVELVAEIPGVRAFKIGKTTWIEWRVLLSMTRIPAANVPPLPRADRTCTP